MSQTASLRFGKLVTTISSETSFETFPTHVVAKDVKVCQVCSGALAKTSPSLMISASPAEGYKISMYPRKRLRLPKKISNVWQSFGFGLTSLTHLISQIIKSEPSVCPLKGLQGQYKLWPANLHNDRSGYIHSLAAGVFSTVANISPLWPSWLFRSWNPQFASIYCAFQCPGVHLFFWKMY